MDWRSGFRRKLFGNLQSYAYTVSGDKNVAQELFWWYKCYEVIHWRYLKRKRQTSELYQWEWGRRNWRFSLLSLAISSEPSHSRPQLLYCTLQPLSVSSLTPKQMTLNDLEIFLNCHFALKCVLSSASNGLAFSLLEKAVRKFADLRIYTVSGKNVAQGLYWCVMEVFTGVTEQEASNQWTVHVNLGNRISSRSNGSWRMTT